MEGVCNDQHDNTRSSGRRKRHTMSISTCRRSTRMWGLPQPQATGIRQVRLPKLEDSMGSSRIRISRHRLSLKGTPLYLSLPIVLINEVRLIAIDFSWSE